MDERRKYVRLDTRLKITYTILQRGGEKTLSSETKDIGGGGIRLFLSEPLPTDTLLKLDIQLPEEPKPISCLGKIVWTDEFIVLQGRRRQTDRYEAGVSFTQIDSRDRDRIIQYVILGYAPEKR